MDRSRTFARNVASLTTANFVISAVPTVVQVIVLNYLGTQRYGTFTAAMAFATVFLMFAETGVGMRFLYDRSGDKTNIDEHFGAALFLQFVPYMASLALTVACAFLFAYDSLFIGIVAIVSLAAVFRIFAEICEKVLTVYQHLHMVALLRSVRFIAIAIGGILVVICKWDVLAWAIVQLVAMLIFAVCTIAVTLRYVRPKLIYSTLWPTLAASYIFGLGAVFFAIYENVDAVMLTKLLPGVRDQVMGQIGVYRTPYVLMMFTFTIPGAFIASMEPLIFAAKAEPPELARLAGLSNRGIGIIAAPLCLAIALLSRDIRSLVFPRIDADAASILSILTVYGFLRFMNFSSGMTMAAAGLQVRRVVFQAAAVGFNIAGNFVFILWIGIYGAAIMTVATECLIFLSYHVSIKKRISGYSCFPHLVKPFVASAIMGALILACRFALDAAFPENRFVWLVVVPVGASAYFAVLACCGYFTDDEKAFARRLIARLWPLRTAR